MTDFSHLPLRERVKKYREQAAEARRVAGRIDDRDIRDAYIIIAERWEALALDVERRLARGLVVGTAGGRHVSRVEVAVARVAPGGRCSWYRHGRFGRATSCARPVYLPATGVARWKRRVAAGGRGTYRVLSRALPGQSRPSLRTFQASG